MMSLSEYAMQLVGVDWTHEYSDDHRVYMAGKEQVKFLRALAGPYDDHVRLFLFMARKGGYYA